MFLPVLFQTSNNLIRQNRIGSIDLDGIHNGAQPGVGRTLGFLILLVVVIVLRAGNNRPAPGIRYHFYLRVLQSKGGMHRFQPIIRMRDNNTPAFRLRHCPLKDIFPAGYHRRVCYIHLERVVPHNQIYLCPFKNRVCHCPAHLVSRLLFAGTHQ